MAHVGGMDFEHVVETTRDVVTFHHFGNLLYDVGEFYRDFAVDAGEFDVAIHHQSVIELACVEFGYISLDEALVLEASHPLIHRSGGEVHFPCYFFGGEARVFLEDAHNFHVGAVGGVHD